MNFLAPHIRRSKSISNFKSNVLKFIQPTLLSYLYKQKNDLKIKGINCSILESSDVAVTKILLFGDNTLSNSSNTLILNSTIEYHKFNIISTQRFEGSILTSV